MTPVKFEVTWQTARWLKQNSQCHSMIIVPQADSTNHTVLVDRRKVYAQTARNRALVLPELGAVLSRAEYKPGLGWCTLKPGGDGHGCT